MLEYVYTPPVVLVEEVDGVEDLVEVGVDVVVVVVVDVGVLVDEVGLDDEV